jgi:hypothetical protein
MALQPEHVLSPEVSEALADALRPVKLAAGERDLMRARILNRVRAAPPDGTATIRAHEGIWQDYAPGVQIKMLHGAGLGSPTARPRAGRALLGVGWRSLDGRAHPACRRLACGTARINAPQLQ